MYCYCVFCVTAKCDAIAAILRERLGCVAYAPKIVQRRWVRGQCFEEIRALLPGYVFLYTESPIERFWEVRGIEGVMRFLGRPDEGRLLQGDDLRFAEMLRAHDGVIGILKTYREGDRVKLAKSLLNGFEGEIIRIDRRKGRAQVEYAFDGSTYRMWVGFDMIEDEPFRLG